MVATGGAACLSLGSGAVKMLTAPARFCSSQGPCRPARPRLHGHGLRFCDPLTFRAARPHTVCPYSSRTWTEGPLSLASNAVPVAAVWAAIEAPRLLLPVVATRLQAGFPSPADDFAVKRHDLNELLVTHPLATFFWRVAGKSMLEAGIDDGDLLVVDRALTPSHRSIVVAQVDGDFTVKYLHQRNGRVKLVAANPTFPDIVFKDGQSLVICGVVTCAIKRFVG